MTLRSESRAALLGSLLGIASGVGCGSDLAASQSGPAMPSFSEGAEPPSAENAALPSDSPMPPEPGAVPVADNPEVVVTPGLAPIAPATEPAPPVSAETTPPAPPETPVGRHGPLHVEGPRLVDASGVPVQLKGVSTMWLNWEDRYSSSREALEWMRDHWGVSVIRAALGVEPLGAYLTDPEPSLEHLRQVIQNAIDVGVYVVVDWHDHHAEQHREQAVAFFSRIADEYGQSPNVLYETFNEPLDLDWSTVIKPYHEAVLGAIRARDPDNVAILGTRSWSQRVDEAALDRVAGRRRLDGRVAQRACSVRDRAAPRLSAREARDGVWSWAAASFPAWPEPAFPPCFAAARSKARFTLGRCGVAEHLGIRRHASVCEPHGSGAAC